jgi:stringent starvation protein B
MGELTSTKPYLIRALHEWCVDNGLTPHLLVAVNAQTRVPMAYVKDGEIVLNLNYSATKDLLIGNEAITFSARFSGVSNNLYVPMDAVRGVFARENGQGMFFEVEAEESLAAEENVPSEDDSPEMGGEVPEKTPPTTKKPSLKLVK